MRAYLVSAVVCCALVGILGGIAVAGSKSKNSSKNGSSKNGSSKNGSTYETNGSSKNGSSKNGSSKNGSSKNGSGYETNGKSKSTECRCGWWLEAKWRGCVYNPGPFPSKSHAEKAAKSLRKVYKAEVCQPYQDCGCESRKNGKNGQNGQNGDNGYPNGTPA